MYTITELERQVIYDAYFASMNPLVLKQFPKKLKRKYAISQALTTLFDDDTVYDEKGINATLKPVWHDYVMVRRLLVDFGFLTRTKDGSEYRITKQGNNL